MNAKDPVLKLTLEQSSMMPDFGLCDRVWQAVSDAFYGQNPTWFEAGSEVKSPESVFAAKLSAHWSAAYAIHEFEYDILSGGLSNFFLNHDGVLNEALLRAFTLVGAHEYVAPFVEVVRIFDSFNNTLYNRNWEHTEEEYEEEDSKFYWALSRPGAEIMELLMVDEARTYLASYIRANLTKYQKGDELPNPISGE